MSLRRDAVGDDVTYVVNRNINFTNICYTGCRFCAFAQRKGDADAFTLSDRRGRRPGVGGARRGRDRGVHAGRHRPRTAGHRVRRSGARGQGAGAVDARARVQSDGDRQRRLAGRPERPRLADRAARGRAWTPSPARPRRSSTTRCAGCSPRANCRPPTWIEVVTTAHEVGLRSSSTMMYGHVDHPKHWVGHLRVLRDIQDRTGGFTEFVPLPFVHQSRPAVPGRRGAAGPDQPRQPRGARPGPDHAARPHPQYSDQLGQARRRPARR